MIRFFLVRLGYSALCIVIIVRDSFCALIDIKYTMRGLPTY